VPANTTLASGHAVVGFDHDFPVVSTIVNSASSLHLLRCSPSYSLQVPFVNQPPNDGHNARTSVHVALLLHKRRCSNFSKVVRRWYRKELRLLASIVAHHHETVGNIVNFCGDEGCHANASVC